MQRILGIDLGAHAVKTVAIDASFRSHVVREVHSAPVPPSPEGGDPVPWSIRVKEALASLAAGGHFRAEAIICSMPGTQVATQSMAFPYGDLKLVQKIMPGQLEDLELGEIVYDAQVVSRSATSSEMLVAIARSEDLSNLLSLLGEAGIDPDVVTFSSVSLANLLSENYVAAAVDSAVALVDVGAETTKIVLAHQGETLVARTVLFGGQDVTRAIARSESIAWDAAEEIKRTNPSIHEHPAVVRALATLSRELRATFATLAAGGKGRVTRVVLTGGGAQLSGVDQALAHALGVTVERISLTPGHALPDDSALATHSLALALALRGPGGTKADKLNFRKGAFAAASTGGSWRDRAGTLAAMAAILLVLVYASASARISALEAREKALDDTLCETTKKILGTCETNYKGAIAKLKGKGSPAAAVPAVSALDLSVAMGDVFPPGDDAVLSDLDIIDTTVSMRGDARSYEAVDKLVESIQANPCFTDIKKGNLTKGRNDRIEFKLDANFGCGTNKKAGT